MIVVLFTGGTISMRHDPLAGGALPSPSPREILAAASGVESVAEIEVEEWGASPGLHMSAEVMFGPGAGLGEPGLRELFES